MNQWLPIQLLTVTRRLANRLSTAPVWLLLTMLASASHGQADATQDHHALRVHPLYSGSARPVSEIMILTVTDIPGTMQIDSEAIPAGVDEIHMLPGAHIVDLSLLQKDEWQGNELRHWNYKLDAPAGATGEMRCTEGGTRLGIAMGPARTGTLDGKWSGVLACTCATASSCDVSDPLAIEVLVEAGAGAFVLKGRRARIEILANDDVRIRQLDGDSCNELREALNFQGRRFDTDKLGLLGTLGTAACKTILHRSDPDRTHR